MDASTMQACVLHGVRQLSVRPMAKPAPGPSDVLVRVRAVGLCGTDLHIFSGEANYNTDDHGVAVPLSEQPQILGHEIIGEIEHVGSVVHDLAVGDRVAIDQGLNCISQRRSTRCEYCATGDSHQCEFYREHGITGLPGGLAEWIAVPAVNAIPVRSDLPITQAAMTEPLACVTHSMETVGRASHARYSVAARDPERRVRSVLIFGAGPAGLLFTQYLRRVANYDGLILVSEPNARKRALAAQFGAEVVDPATDAPLEALRELSHGRMAELVIESSGAGRVFENLPALLRKQATVLLYGHGRGGTDLSVLNRLQFKEPTLISPVGASGGFEPDGRPSAYVHALRLLERGTVEVGPLLTHQYHALDDVSHAFSHDFARADFVKGIVTLP